uniref:Uncharacterized protein n=1 Tax=Arundo donax TaxID=35708 RepID=A0A0A9DWQ1_ARUDO
MRRRRVGAGAAPARGGTPRVRRSWCPPRAPPGGAQRLRGGGRRR